MEKEARKNSKVLQALPIVPYLAFGLIVSWTQISRGTYLVSPSLLADGSILASPHVVSTLANGFTLLIAGFMFVRTGPFLDKPRHLLACGITASVCSAAIVIIDTLGLPPNASRILVGLFYVGTGIGTAFVFLKVGELYAGLSGREAVMYLGWSHVLAGGIFFVIVGMEGLILPNTSKSLAIVIGSVALPTIAAWWATMTSDKDAELGRSTQVGAHSLPFSFWKLTAVIFILSFIMAAVSSAWPTMDPNPAVSDSRIVNFARIAMAFVLIWSALSIEAERFQIGKVYSLIMVLSVIIVTMAPVMMGVFEGWGRLSDVVMMLFKVLHWTVLCLIVCQRRTSPLFVFGVSVGLQALGSACGNIVGAFALRGVMGSSLGLVLCIACTLVIVVCAFLLFSEKDFDRLFEPDDEPDRKLIDLFAPIAAPSASSESEGTASKAAFSEAIEAISNHYALTKREKEVLRYLAMGYNAKAISEKLFISWNTVRGHSRNVYAKLGIQSKQELIQLVETQRHKQKHGE